MAISSQTYTGNNSVTTFPVSFDWIYVSDIIVTVDSFVKVNGTDYTIVNKNVVFTNAPSTGVVVKIARSSNLTTRIVDFVNGSRLDESDLDNSAKQLFYLIQELKDQTDDVSTRITNAAAALILPDTVGNTALQADAVTLSKIANGAVSPAKLSSGGPSWTEAGVLSAVSFAGPLTGNVTGNVTGSSGSCTGNAATATTATTASGATAGSTLANTTAVAKGFILAAGGAPLNAVNITNSTVASAVYTLTFTAGLITANSVILVTVSGGALNSGARVASINAGANQITVQTYVGATATAAAFSVVVF